MKIRSAGFELLHADRSTDRLDAVAVAFLATFRCEKADLEV
jgi:hypothetical protein